MTRKNLAKLWNESPRFVRAGLWIGVSAGLTGIVSHLLEQPEMMAYSGILNVILVALKESKDRKVVKK